MCDYSTQQAGILYARKFLILNKTSFTSSSAGGADGSGIGGADGILGMDGCNGSMVSNKQNEALVKHRKHAQQVKKQQTQLLRKYKKTYSHDAKTNFFLDLKDFQAST